MLNICSKVYDLLHRVNLLGFPLINMDNQMWDARFCTKTVLVSRRNEKETKVAAHYFEI